MVTKLIGRTGAVAGRDFVMPDDVTVVRIGAGPNNEITIRADGVSREHARLVRRADGCWVEDAGSSNGTFVNGLRIKAERLRHLDVVTLGRRVDLIFIQSETAATAEPTGKVHSASLEFLNGPSANTKVDIPIGEITIGRAPGCNVVVNHPSIGKIHARIRRSDSQVTIEDLQSTNGTFVNDEKISLAVLKNDDHVSIATVAQFRTRILADFGAGMPVEASAESAPMPSYDQEWRTRLVWSPAELAEIEKARAGVLDMMDQSSEQPAPGARRRPQAAPRAVPQPERPVPAPVVSKYVAPAAAAPEPAATIAMVARSPAVGAVEVAGGENGMVRLGVGAHTIGRSAQADVRLTETDREVSRVHAILTVGAGGDVSIEGRGTNGTFLNEQRVNGTSAVRDGDKVRCGGTTLTVRFVS